MFNFGGKRATCHSVFDRRVVLVLVARANCNFQAHFAFERQKPKTSTTKRNKQKRHKQQAKQQNKQQTKQQQNKHQTHLTAERVRM